ncbi:hypothetical protein ABD89_01515 [Lysinibacillus sphaericus]|nr:hypothetical protein [Lysinibacillus sphaericus]
MGVGSLGIVPLEMADMALVVVVDKAVVDKAVVDKVLVDKAAADMALVGTVAADKVSDRVVDKVVDRNYQEVLLYQPRLFG